MGQDPLASFVTAHVETELAFGLEQQGFAPATMRRRVEDTLDLLGIAALRDRRLDTLSLGQAQRVALGAVLVSEPSVLLLDEPTSALDPVAADDVVGALRRLAHDVGLTVVVAEHRVEALASRADVRLRIEEGRVVEGEAADLPAAASTVAQRPERRAGAVALCASGITVRHRGVVAVDEASLVLWPGELVALVGPNGAGKSTLLSVLTGDLSPAAGTVSVDGRPLGSWSSH